MLGLAGFPLVVGQNLVTSPSWHDPTMLVRNGTATRTTHARPQFASRSRELEKKRRKNHTLPNSKTLPALQAPIHPPLPKIDQRNPKITRKTHFEFEGKKKLRAISVV